MAGLISRHGLMMREVFNITNHDVAHWFPGHMAKGLNQMQRKLKSVDCIIEVHDARLPISGRNPLFESHLGLSQLKPHILILNKIDLVDMRQRNRIEKYYTSEGRKNVIFTNGKNPNNKGVKSIVPRVVDIINNSERYNRSEEIGYQAMIIGIPNVGKSSIINALRAKHLRRGKATAVGAVPGITRGVLERIKVCEKPPIFLLDTPGVMAPRISDVEMGLKLALAATIKDHLVGENVIADYLLYRLNYAGNHSYVKYLDLDEPSDNIQDVLMLAAVRNNLLMKLRDHRGVNVVPNLPQSAGLFLKGFRTGAFGKIFLDQIPHVRESD